MKNTFDYHQYTQTVLLLRHMLTMFTLFHFKSTKHLEYLVIYMIHIKCLYYLHLKQNLYVQKYKC